VLTYEEAVAAVTGPGQRYEVVEAEVAGTTMKVFRNTPPSLGAMFAASRRRGDATFLAYEDEQWSFDQVMDTAAALGQVLVRRYGVSRGDRVAIAMRNYPEWVVAFAAITSVGAVVVPLNAWWTAGELGYALDDAGATVVIADRERVEVLAGLFDAHPEVRVLSVRAAAADLPAVVTGSGRHDRWEDVVVAGPPMPEVDVSPDDDATIFYTSGTTGHPKGAVSTHRAVLSALLAFNCGSAITRAREGDPAVEHPWPRSFILCVPLFHVTGCVPVMLSCFMSGLKLVMMYKWDPARALELVERHHVTNFVGVPTMSWDLLECPDFDRYDTSSLLNVGGGGAAAPPELVRRIDSRFGSARPNIGYGMTETNAYGTGNAGDDYLRKPTSSGRAVPIVEMRVTAEDGRVLRPGQVGEIWFRGPNNIRGYWNQPEATAEAIVDGWLRTGDLGYLDEEGFVFVVDRAKDMVIRGGENVYCAEVEAALYEHPAVYEAAVFGLPHDRLGEEVAAAVLPKPDADLDIDELRAFLAERLAPYMVPSVIHVAGEALPRNASGKILKREIRDDLRPVPPPG
jgi:long-chain acyl-CoA synthetase